MASNIANIKQGLESVRLVFHSIRGRNGILAAQNQKLLKTSQENTDLSEAEREFLNSLDAVIRLKSEDIRIFKKAPSVNEVSTAYHRFLHSLALTKLEQSHTPELAKLITRIEQKGLPYFKEDLWFDFVDSLRTKGIANNLLERFISENSHTTITSPVELVDADLKKLKAIFASIPKEFAEYLLQEFNINQLIDKSTFMHPDTLHKFSKDARFSFQELIDIGSDSRVASLFRYIESFSINKQDLHSFRDQIASAYFAKKDSQEFQTQIYNLTLRFLKNLNSKEANSSDARIKLAIADFETHGAEILNFGTELLQVPSRAERGKVTSLAKYADYIFALSRHMKPETINNFHDQPIGKSRAIVIPINLRKILQNRTSKYRLFDHERQAYRRSSQPGIVAQDLKFPDKFQRETLPLPIQALRTEELRNGVFEVSTHINQEGSLALREEHTGITVPMINIAKLRKLSTNQAKTTLRKLLVTSLFQIFEKQRHPDDFVRISQDQDAIENLIDTDIRATANNKFPYYDYGLLHPIALHSEQLPLTNPKEQIDFATRLARNLNMGFVNSTATNLGFRKLSATVINRVYDCLMLGIDILKATNDPDIAITNKRQKSYFEFNIQPLLNITKTLVRASFGNIQRSLAKMHYIALTEIPLMDAATNALIDSEAQSLKHKFNLQEIEIEETRSNLAHRKKYISYDELKSRAS